MLSKSQQRIADMLRRAGRKVTVIDETKDPKKVADEKLRAEQEAAERAAKKAGAR